MIVEFPESWTRGELLNVRNYGPFFAVTQLGTEYDSRLRNGLQFSDALECQNFVSWWYAPPMFRMQERGNAGPC